MTHKQKIDLGKILLSAVLFFTGLATDIIWFYLAAYVIAGYETIIDAVLGMVNRQFLDEHFLMTIASAGAIYCEEYPEAVAVMLFFLVGEFFEHYAVNSSRASIAELMDIRADFALRLHSDGSEESVEPEALNTDDIILVRPGEKVPADGIVLSGTSTLNTAALTGESLPRDIVPGQEIISGTINLTGALKIKVTKPYEDSTVAKVLDLVENASSRKATVERFITKFARYYTPLVVLAAVLLAVLPPLLTARADFADWLYRAMIFLVISCPCALVISVPLSLFAGVGSASKNGILVKGSNYLEALSQVDSFAFDKTGTLTTGNFAVTDIYAAHPADADAQKLLAIAAYGESLSNHPIAQAIVSHYENHGGSVTGTRVTAYKEISGKGIFCKLDGFSVYCGNLKLMEEAGLHVANPDETGSVVHVARNGSYLGYLVVTDTVRENSASAIRQLKSLGVKHTVMLTGDRKEIAQTVGDALGIEQVMAELLPGDKVAAFEKLMGDKECIQAADSKKKSRGSVVFVGDGINDAPVLARADVGIAMGAFGSDAAIEAADVVIMADDISKLAVVMQIARKTLRICKQNVTFALTVKFGVMFLGALGLASMWAAVFADVGVAVIAILNAMRAMR